MMLKTFFSSSLEATTTLGGCCEAADGEVGSCQYFLFKSSPCKFEKDGLRLDLEQELFESADDDNDVMSKPYE